MLKKLIDWFKEQFFMPTSSRREWEPIFIPSDVEKIDFEKKFSAEAEKWGALNQPGVTANSADAGETRIYLYFRQMALELNANVERRQGEYQNVLYGDKHKQLLQEIKAAPQNLSIELDRVKLQTQQLQQQNEEALARAEADLSSFRDSNGIDREPLYPKSNGKYWALPFLLLSIEIGFNAFVFSFAEDGLRGGIQIALILGIINVIISTLLGRTLRAINSRNVFQKASGVLIALLLFLYAPFNLLVAHFRDASLDLSNLDGMSLSDAVSRQANLFPDSIHSFVAAPFSLGSIESWGLFLIGVTFAVISAHHGYKSDDPIPGYSQQDKKVKELKEDVLNGRETLTSNLDQVYEELSLDLAEKVKTFDHLSNRSMEYFQLTRSLLVYHRTQMEDYHSSYKVLIQRYRAENVRARADGVSPAYFSEHPVPLDVPKLAIDLNVLEVQEQEARRYFDQAVVEIQLVKETFSRLWREANNQ